MARDHGPSVKNDRTYEALRDKGASKSKAARIANAQAREGKEPSRRGGRHPAYEEWTKADLLDRARSLGIEGRSRMRKAELIDALRTS